jgi:hypothetical protein
VRPSFSQLEQATQKLASYLDAESRHAKSIEIAIKLPLVVEDTSSDPEFPTRGRPADIASAIERYRELGTQHFVFDLIPETVDCALTTMERFAQDIRPHLS